MGLVATCPHMRGYSEPCWTAVSRVFYCLEICSSAFICILFVYHTSLIKIFLISDIYVGICLFLQVPFNE